MPKTYETNGSTVFNGYNAVIEYLNGKLPASSLAFIDGHPVEISVITRIELLAWPGATTAHLEVLNNFIASSIVHLLDEPVILKIIEIRKTKRCKLPDAIIATTAIKKQLTLLTNNLADFSNIKNLSLANPHQL